jgi:hypothetical protein
MIILGGVAPPLLHLKTEILRKTQIFEKKPSILETNVVKYKN